MADITDDASDVETMWSEYNIRQARIEANQPKQIYTHCRFCGDPTESGAEFCSYGPNSCATDAQWHDGIIAKQTNRKE
jgi:hypothetical protein